MQKFFSTTLVSKFIKYLLMVTPLPICSYLYDNAIMVEGGYYVYQEKVYKCTKTGLFKGSYKTYEDYLYCSDVIHCGDALSVTNNQYEFGGAELARYNVVDLIEEGVPIHGLTETFISTRTDYDSYTHKKLGDYLRFIHSQYGINLMPLYNCFSEYYVDGVDLTSGRLRETNVSGYKTSLVPIKFNRKYTIAMDSNSPVFIAPVLFEGKLLRRCDKQDKFLIDNGSNPVKKISLFRYKHPRYIEISNTDSELQPYEKNLYLAIQMPISVVSPITVLEGEYSVSDGIQVYDDSMFTKSADKFMDSVLVSKLSLLDMKTTLVSGSSSVPFSDKLISYLLRHTIDNRDLVSENIIRVTDAFGYKKGYEGSWEPEIRGKLFDSYMSLKDNRQELNYTDILGYVDADIERALDNGWLRNNNSIKFNRVKMEVK